MMKFLMMKDFGEQISDYEFIDDMTGFDDQQPQVYYTVFKNVTRDPEEVANYQNSAHSRKI